jgi:hypothetical protein
MAIDDQGVQQEHEFTAHVATAWQTAVGAGRVPRELAGRHHRA